jgi:2-polyprenyl-3-methyl-5-hydroxy-6-metoxy-1,4-benzoquinol methylase
MNSTLDDYVESYHSDFKYSLDNKLILNWYPQRVLNMMNPGSLLELGIGHGYTASAFSNKVDRYQVIEGSNAVISLFKQQFDCAKIDIVECFFEDFDTDERFDNILMGFVLEHVHDPGFIVNKYKKFLSENGKLFVAVPNSEALNRRIGLEASLLDNLEYLSEADRLLGHKRYFNMNKLEKLEKSSGMRIVSTEGIFLKPITTEQIRTLGFDDNILKAFLKVGINYPELCVAILMELRHEK